MDGRSPARRGRALLVSGGLAVAAGVPPPGRDAGPSHLVRRERGAASPPVAWLDRPECGNDAVLWKERYFAPADIFTKLVLLPAIVCVTLPLALITEVQGGIGQVILDFWQHGTGAARFVREDLVWALRLDVGWYTAFWLLAVAGASASSVTLEREEDTWVSLTATPLTGWQILRAKVLGAIWNQRGFGAVLVFLWSAALLTGAVNPQGVLASIAVVGVLTWLVAAVGIYFSLHATSTSRALVSTIVAALSLQWLSADPHLLVPRITFWDSSFTLLGFMPRLAVAPLVSRLSAAEPWWGACRPSACQVDPLAYVPYRPVVARVSLCCRSGHSDLADRHSGSTAGSTGRTASLGAGTRHIHAHGIIMDVMQMLLEIVIVHDGVPRTDDQTSLWCFGKLCDELIEPAFQSRHDIRVLCRDVVLFTRIVAEVK